MSDYTTSVQEALKEVRKELLKYCHHKKCRFPERCPTDHPKCKKKLGIDTAIAWRAAQHIASLLHMEEANPINLNDVIQNCLERIGEHVNTVSLSSKEFPQLLTLLNKTIFWINTWKRDLIEKESRNV